MFSLILILRIISFPVSILSILMFIGSLYNSIGLTGGVYGGDFITYICVFMIPLFGMWGIFHFIYFDNYIKESNHGYEGLIRFIKVLFLCSLYFFLGRLLEILLFYQIFKKIHIEEKDYFSIILLIVSIFSIILINKFNNIKLLNLFK